MRICSLVPLLMAVVAALAAPSLGAIRAVAANELVWKSLFAPPYSQSAPSVMIALACLSKDLCFVPGSSNNNGYVMYQFDGRVNGNFTLMTEPNSTLIVMAIAAGGSAAKPRAAFGGIGLGNLSAGLQYLSAAKGETWLPSQMPPELIWQTETVSASADGQHIISFGSGRVNNWVMHSADAGKSFERANVSVAPLQTNCTWPQDAALATGDTWFVTLGGYTGEHHNNNAQAHQVVKRLSAGLVLERDPRSGAVKPTLRRLPKRSHLLAQEEKAAGASADPYQCYYTGQIARTTDGGKSWETVFSSWEFTLQQIDCISATHCVAVGWGVTYTDIEFTVILTTTNGRDWNETLRLNNTTVTLNAVQFADAQEVWVAGADVVNQFESAGVLFSSRDGGATWKRYSPDVPDILGIMDLSFTPDGSVGFAAAITLFQTSTILRYEKQSFSGYFTQQNCPFSNNCTGSFGECQNVTFPQGMCLESGSGSVTASCGTDHLEQRVFDTPSCTGSFRTMRTPLRTCLNITQGGSFENFCNTTAV